jgi:predicted acyl esterase
MKDKAVSQPIYTMRTEKDVYVTMRDRTRLAVDIYRPDSEGRFPALLAMSPYGKELQSLPLPPQPRAFSAIWDGSMEAGDMEYFVSRGYAHIIADLRGTGYSDGEYIGLSSHKEGEDGHDLVEWIAQQPWCDGNVGMIGYSYFGEIQMHVAAEQPPHLKAVFPAGVFTDLYRQMTYQGGILNTFLYGLWDGRDGDSGFAQNRVVSAMMGNLPKEKLNRLFQQALSNPDIRKYPNFYHLLKYPNKNPLFVDILLNPYDGPFYWERSAYTKFNKIRIPVYSAGVWSSGFNVFGNTALYCGIDSPKKLMMGPPGHPDRPWVALNSEIIRWYDHWLKGIDNGIMDEPPVKIFIMGANQWRYEREWPVTRAKPTKFYLRGWKGLSLEPELYYDEPDCFIQQPLYLSSKTEFLRYMTPALQEDIEIIGPIALYLFASIDTDDTNWMVALYDVDIDEDGSEIRPPLTHGWLKASHRALDEKRSSPLQPHHPHTSSEPVVPGEIYEYAIEIGPMANLFRAGHRIKLEIKSIDSPKDPAMHKPPGSFHICSSKITLHKIYRDRQHPSHLLMPIVPRT